MNTATNPTTQALIDKGRRFPFEPSATTPESALSTSMDPPPERQIQSTATQCNRVTSIRYTTDTCPTTATVLRTASGAMSQQLTLKRQH